MAERRLIEVGRIAGAFGVRGEVRITSFTEDPMALLRYRDLMNQDASLALSLTQARPAKGGIVARARQIETREQAEAARGQRLYIDRAALPAPEDDEFYLADLIGLEARSPDGAVLGRVRAVENFGAGDLLEVAPAGGGPTWWLAFTREAAPDVSIAGGFITLIQPAETEGEAPDAPE